MTNRLPCIRCGWHVAAFEFCQEPGCPAYAAYESAGVRPEPEVSTLARDESRPPSIIRIKPRLFED